MNVVLPFLDLEVVVRHPGRLIFLLVMVLLAVVLMVDSRARARALEKPWFVIRVPVAMLPGFWRRFFWWSGAGLAIVFFVVAWTVVERRIVEYDPVYGHMRITLILDNSFSVYYADEIPNRMELEKEMMRDMVNILWTDPGLKGRYSIAIIPFAGSANHLFAPFSTSREEILAATDELNPETVTTPGTSLLNAVFGYEELLLRHLPPGGEETTEVAFLISDGGKEEGRGGERRDLPAAISKLKEASSVGGGKLILSTVGIGKFREEFAEGSPVPKRVPIPAKLVVRDKDGKFVKFLRKDDKDPRSPVLESGLDEEILEYLASLGGGSYIHAANKDKILAAFKDTVLKYRKKVNEVPRPRYEPISRWLIIPGFLFLFLLFGCANWMVRLVRSACRGVGKRFA